ncbi:MAG: hypothetical protein QE274_13170 [Verrucomicrobiaceae bacterium]|jgi:hypothetical protein|nr:hypothetical protein [Verrucomicrobiaceae bacterium]
MKAILVLIIAAALTFLSYKFVYPPIAASLGIDKLGKEEPTPIVVVAPKPEKTEPIPEAPTPVMEAPKPEAPKPEMPVVMAPEPAPTPEPTKPKEGEFVPPEFPPIETVVGNWSTIPKSAFPRPVKMNRQFEFKIKIGSGTASSVVPAGRDVIAVAQQGQTLVIAPTPDSTARGEVSMEDTNLKDVLTSTYDKWKVWRLETLRRAHEFKKTAGSRVIKSGPTVAGDDKPEKNAEGAYPLLLASMSAGEVTEIKPDNIKEWGEVAREKIDDTDFWTIIVKYETVTMFGKFDTEAQARIKNGKVLKWVYTGSGEVVP